MNSSRIVSNSESRFSEQFALQRPEYTDIAGYVKVFYLLSQKNINMDTICHLKYFAFIVLFDCQKLLFVFYFSTLLLFYKFIVYKLFAYLNPYMSF